MLNLIGWERTADGEIAGLKRQSPSHAISRSYADGLVKSLMHDVVSLSAMFETEGVVTFGKCAEVSVFDVASAEFYGLYMSSALGSFPDYCLRRCYWNGDFKNVDSLLAGFSAETIFVNSACLDGQYKGLVEKLDSPEGDVGEVVSLIRKRLELGVSRVNYFLVNQNINAMHGYRRRDAVNEKMEKVFDDLKSMYRVLRAGELIKAIPSTFQILYLNDCYSRVFDNRD